ncbi:acetylornithine aminotransferase apoenzyme [Methanosarcina thermophila]|uniref:Acetylornithine aminotransferase n=3 Tax=Methanosarcina thermophila TaxID=2210 RepID=A0A1I6ZKQ9_METTE|nr:acetylornithine transaminase [Methanosarcina thermophila]ALK04939.1 MAG: acetylornithine aminotransferase [Methanosarcina sp. 795]AKB13661.1 Acetylornithine aminotransferase [Methanosarcina thermophila TM-1]AKB15698.1 Acetylornithine aminotransferase [Methanosarcina thermophila CHTI-55]NLU57583.1 acetylornithine transaminase [Methanosarcina thermophila]SFT63221.1 acetylornithine aminotransferase apoenzyme [Methanosarcina thermophila]
MTENIIKSEIVSESEDLQVKYDSIIEKDSKYVMQTYGRQPLVLSEGKGAIVRDIYGKEYIDCVAGIAVNNVGHCHPRVVKAIQSQAEKLMHVSNLYYTEIQAELAETLVSITGMERVFFCNSGAEAVESAMKLARVTSGKSAFIAAEHSFHGRTIGALSVTHKSMYRDPFMPPVSSETTFVPYSNAEAIRQAISEDTAAVILEPIQGEGGVNIPDPDYLKEVREICDETGTFLIFDEVQTGFGRTGTWFCKEQFGVEPDIMSMAKAIGGGFPMGAIAAREGLSFGRGQHASTFGGGPLACAAALASIEAIREEELLKRSKENGTYFMGKLRNMDREDVIEVRGKGLMIGVEIKYPCSKFVEFARECGVLLNCTSDSVLRLVPPLVITKEQIDTVVDVLEQA